MGGIQNTIAIPIYRVLPYPVMANHNYIYGHADVHNSGFPAYAKTITDMCAHRGLYACNDTAKLCRYIQLHVCI